MCFASTLPANRIEEGTISPVGTRKVGNGKDGEPDMEQGFLGNIGVEEAILV